MHYSTVRSSLPPSFAALTVAVGLSSGCRLGFEFRSDINANAEDGNEGAEQDDTENGSGGAPFGWGGAEPGEPRGDGGTTRDAGNGGETSSGGGTEDDDGGGGNGSDNGQNQGTGGERLNLDLILVVTTEADENDIDATVSTPGGSGLSLREALTLANRSLLPQAVVFSRDDFQIRLSAPLPALTGSVTVSGPANLVGSELTDSAPCLQISGSMVIVNDLEIQGCPSEPVLFTSNSEDSVLSNCDLHDNDQAVVLDGERPIALSNAIKNSGGRGIEVSGSRAQVLQNRVMRSAYSNIVIHTAAHDVLVMGNLSLGGDNGIALGNVDDARIWHNTVVDSGSSALDLGEAEGVDVRNNVFVGAARYGVAGSNGQLTPLDYNLYFENAADDCSACVLGSNAVHADPRFRDPTNENYELGDGSPALDAGFDLGQDRNSRRPGLFDGPAPDLGYLESP